MKDHHKKFVELNKLVPQTKNNKNKQKEVESLLVKFMMNCMTFTKVNTTKI